MRVSPAEAQSRSGQGDTFQTLKQEWKQGNTALDKDQDKAALAHYERVFALLQQAPDAVDDQFSAAVYHNRGAAHYGLEQWKLAIADYSKCIELAPRDAQAYAARGVARKATGNYTGLIADAEKAAQIDHQYASFLDDARSTVLWRRMKLGFFGLALVLLAIGGYYFLGDLWRVLKASPTA